jgi:hypothetical protein
MLTSASYPFLTTETNSVLEWSDAAHLQRLYRALWIEVAPRGVRLITEGQRWAPARRWSARTPCAPTPYALCRSNQSRLFPSQDSPFDVMDRDSARALLTDPIARSYALEDSCLDHGQGRALLNPNVSAPFYTVTACDIMNGHLVALWDADADGIQLAPQTFGPMAYCVVLLEAVACLYFATTIASHQSASSESSVYAASASALCLVLSCILLASIHGVPFVVDADARHFGCVCAVAVYLALAAMVWMDTAQAGEACVHALSAMVCAIYRSPENAYAGLLAIVLAVRLWDKLLQWERWFYSTCPTIVPPSTSARAWAHAFDCLFTAPILVAGTRLGLAPQFDLSAARWPFFAGVSAYISFVFALQRARSAHVAVGV